MPKIKKIYGKLRTSLDEEEVEEELDEHRSLNSLVTHRDSGHHVEDEQCWHPIDQI